jgi:hypothetical protein
MEPVERRRPAAVGAEACAGAAAAVLRKAPRTCAEDQIPGSVLQMRTSAMTTFGGDHGDVRRRDAADPGRAARPDAAGTAEPDGTRIWNRR